MNFNDSDFFAFSVEIVNSFFCGLAGRPHKNYNTLGIRSTIIVERMILSSCNFGDLIHIFFDDIRKICVETVCCFFCLEVYIRVLSSTFLVGVLRIQSTIFKSFYCIPINKFCQIIIIHQLDFLNFVRSSETIEEVDERNT
ncbi:hypothetical protein SDC9_168665 [bioreactor metagenome]|uniref:Uncharacterized protein n=1 Tax=bioreactor metagenome TaxID=1076179 RepID=A0A645G582_9ZZZZ